MVKTIPLSKGYVAIVDDEDYERLSQFKWHASPRKRKCYAQRTLHLPGGQKRTILMHWEVVGKPPKGMHVDHINNNGLDNRRDNLRIVTAQENLLSSRTKERGTSKYRGVHAHQGKWRVCIVHLGKTRHIGCYETEEEAARAYDQCVVQLRGDQAFTNFRKGE